MDKKIGIVKLYNDEEKIRNKYTKLINKKNAKILFFKIIVILIVIYIALNYFFGFCRMKDNSMYPRISQGSLLIYYKFDREFVIGDVVVFNLNNTQYVLRIVAKANQTVEIDELGELLIDGYPDESTEFIYETSISDESDIEFPYIVPDGCVFVVEDYRTEINDSRIFGAISEDSILGKVITVTQTRDI